MPSQLPTLLTLVALGVATFPCGAQNLPGLDKLHRIRSAVYERHIVLHDPRGIAEPWCPAFLEDLRQGGKQLSVVEPRFSTEDPKDSRLKPYNTCSADGERRQQLERTLTDDSSANFWGVSSLGNYAFRVYDLPEPVGKKSVQVVYGEFDSKRAMFNQFPGYTIANVNECRFEKKVAVQSGMQRGLPQQGAPGEAYNLIIRYLHIYFVLDVYDMRMSTETKPLYWMRLTPLIEGRSVSCWWIAS
jgi:hypothetical protein